MRSKSYARSALAFTLPFLLFAARAAQAQIGTGWVQYEPPSTIHLDGSNGIETYPGTSTDLRNEGATFNNQGGIETFTLFNNISNRSERRLQNTYLTGKRQFEGEVRVSPPTDDESIQQVFGGNSGATTQMIRAFDEGGGTLKKVPGFVPLIDKIHGVWVKLNVIHDLPANQVTTYINGKLMTTGDGEATNAGTDGWYHKYGCYGTLRTGSAKVEWRNVKHFRDGVAPDAGASDGGAMEDAGAEDGAPGEGGAGGVAGTGGSGGSVGSGGRPGSGGAGAGGGSGASGSGGASAGTGGKSGTGGMTTGTGGATLTDPPDAGCGCRLGGADRGAGVVLVPVLAWLLARRRRSRGSRG